MWWANWMSLGIIVTHFTCMAQRLASSMRLTKYASAASCRHIMALPWKYKSYLPTSRVISWTSHEKGSFLMRSLVLFWNCWISQRATVPGWYFLVFLTLPAWRNSFWGGFASHSRWELPPDWLLPWSRWPSLYSPLGQLLGWQQWWWPTHILQPSYLLYLPLSLFQHLLHLPCRWGLSGWGWVVHWGGGLLPLAASSFCSSFIQSIHLSPLSFFGVSLVCAILPNKQIGLTVNWKYCYKIQTTK